jgi:hypothetical protein
MKLNLLKPAFQTFSFVVFEFFAVAKSGRAQGIWASIADFPGNPG